MQKTGASSGRGTRAVRLTNATHLKVPKVPNAAGSNGLAPKVLLRAKTGKAIPRRAQYAAERKVENAEREPRSPKRSEHAAHKVRPKERRLKRGTKAAIAEAK